MLWVPAPSLRFPLTRGGGGGVRRQASHRHAWVLLCLVKCGLRRAGPGLISGAAPRASPLSRPRACFPHSFRPRTVPDQAPARKGATPSRRKARPPVSACHGPRLWRAALTLGGAPGWEGTPVSPVTTQHSWGGGSSEGGPGSQAPECCPLCVPCVLPGGERTGQRTAMCWSPVCASSSTADGTQVCPPAPLVSGPASWVACWPTVFSITWIRCPRFPVLTAARGPSSPPSVWGPCPSQGCRGARGGRASQPPG